MNLILIHLSKSTHLGIYFLFLEEKKVQCGRTAKPEIQFKFSLGEKRKLTQSGLASALNCLISRNVSSIEQIHIAQFTWLVRNYTESSLNHV